MCLQSSCKLPISSWKAGTFSFLNIIYSTCFLLREPFRLLFSFSFKWQPLWTSSHQRNINPFVPGNFTAKKPFEAYCRAIFWSLIGYIKRPNWSKLRLQFEHFAGFCSRCKISDSEVGPMSRNGKFAFVFSSFTFRFLFGSGLSFHFSCPIFSLLGL